MLYRSKIGKRLVRAVEVIFNKWFGLLFGCFLFRVGFMLVGNTSFDLIKVFFPPSFAKIESLFSTKNALDYVVAFVNDLIT